MNLITKIVLVSLLLTQCHSLIELELDPKVSSQVCTVLMRSFDVNQR